MPLRSPAEKLHMQHPGDYLTMSWGPCVTGLVIFLAALPCPPSYINRISPLSSLLIGALNPPIRAPVGIPLGDSPGPTEGSGLQVTLSSPPSLPLTELPAVPGLSGGHPGSLLCSSIELPPGLS